MGAQSGAAPGKAATQPASPRLATCIAADKTNCNATKPARHQQVIPRLAGAVDRTDSVDDPTHRRQSERRSEDRPTGWAGRQRQGRLVPPRSVCDVDRPVDTTTTQPGVRGGDDRLDVLVGEVAQRCLELHADIFVGGVQRPLSAGVTSPWLLQSGPGPR